VGRACTLQATYASSSNIKTPSSAEALGEVNQDLHNGRVHVSSVTPIDFLLLSPFLFFLLAKYKSVFSFDFLGEVNQDLHNGRVHVSSVTPIDFLLLSPFLFFLLAKYKSVFSFDFYIQFCFHSFVWYLFFFSFIFF
jgi:hypothetical protein